MTCQKYFYSFTIVKDLRLVLATDRTSGDNLPGTKLAERLFKIQRMDDGRGREQGTQAMMRAYQSTIDNTTNAN